MGKIFCSAYLRNLCALELCFFERPGQSEGKFGIIKNTFVLVQGIQYTISLVMTVGGGWDDDDDAVWK